MCIICLSFSVLPNRFSLCRCLADETAVLLLYTLAHGNSDLLEYVIVRTDLDTLVRKFSSIVLLLVLKKQRFFKILNPRALPIESLGTGEANYIH